MPNGSEAAGQPAGERLVRLETEIEGIGRTLTRLDKTQERQATALERVAEGFARLEAYDSRITRNAEDVMALDREMGEFRDIISRIETGRLVPLESEVTALKADVRAKWFIIVTGCAIGGVIGGLAMDLILRIWF